MSVRLMGWRCVISLLQEDENSWFIKHVLSFFILSSFGDVSVLGVPGAVCFSWNHVLVCTKEIDPVGSVDNMSAVWDGETSPNGRVTPPFFKCFLRPKSIYFKYLWLKRVYVCVQRFHVDPFSIHAGVCSVRSSFFPIVHPAAAASLNGTIRKPLDWSEPGFLLLLRCPSLMFQRWTGGQHVTCPPCYSRSSTDPTVLFSTCALLSFRSQFSSCQSCSNSSVRPCFSFKLHQKWHKNITNVGLNCSL